MWWQAPSIASLGMLGISSAGYPSIQERMDFVEKEPTPIGSLSRLVNPPSFK